MQRVKMSDVARAAGVSTMTVSRALRQDGRIAPETRRKIQRLVQELGYVPDRIAAGFSSRRSGFVGVLVPSLNNTHFAETAVGLQNELHPAGLHMLLGHTSYLKARAEQLVETMLERRPEAMVVTYDDHTPRTRRLLSEAGIPVIEIWEVPPKPIGHVVGFSNRKAAATMTRHLIDLGRRKIGFIGEANDNGTRGAQRRLGFLDAVRAAGLDGSRMITTAEPPIGMLQGRDAMSMLMRRWPDTDAVLCVSDPCAFGAVSACQLAGIAIPDEIAVAGFGDFEISKCSVPAISTISVSGLTIGTEAAHLLRRLLTGDPAMSKLPAQTIVVPSVVEVRGSTLRIRTTEVVCLITGALSCQNGLGVGECADILSACFHTTGRYQNACFVRFDVLVGATGIEPVTPPV
jgi:LacI family transcriptional regulator, gluconate utilization system Gnt-I transcriptional repressor